MKKDEGIGHRNERICKIFYKTNYMEHIGRGISQMTDEMLKFGLDEPQFSEGNDSFKVVFKRKDGDELSSGTSDSIVNLKDFGLNARQIDILTKITNDNMVLSYDDHQRLYGKSRATAERDFSILLENNLVKRFVNNRKVYYASIDY